MFFLHSRFANSRTDSEYSIPISPRRQNSGSRGEQNLLEHSYCQTPFDGVPEASNDDGFSCQHDQDGLKATDSEGLYNPLEKHPQRSESPSSGDSCHDRAPQPVTAPVKNCLFPEDQLVTSVSSDDISNRELDRQIAERKFGTIDNRLERIEDTLNLINKRFRLHEDNIDELQVILYFALTDI